MEPDFVALSPDKAIQLRRGLLDEVMPLRKKVLYVGNASRWSADPDDAHPLSRHYVAEVVERPEPWAGSAPERAEPEGVIPEAAATAVGTVIGCLTLVPAGFDGEPAWQLRALAVEPQFRCRGIGKALVLYAEEDIRDRPEMGLMWCNAVAGAVVFYEKLGWEMVDEVHLIKGVGSHFKLLNRKKGDSD